MMIFTTTLITLTIKMAYSNILDKIPKNIMNDTVSIDYGNIYGDLICRDKDYNWGRDRVNQKNLPLDCSYDEITSVEGVTVYVLDTGIDTSHHLLPNTVWGADCTSGICLEDTENKADIHGHGTHVAGIIGGKEIGIATNVDIVAVKVLDDEGYGIVSSIIKGIVWAYNDIVKRKTKGVINMSLSGKSSQKYYDDIFEFLLENDVIPVVSGGNSGADACNYSPASSEFAITVGSTNIIDHKSSFSNYGECVDIYAPGEDILSTIPNEELDTKSGTSMSAPAVAGVISVLWSRNPELSSEEIIELLMETSTDNKIIGVSVNNKMVYLSNGDGHFYTETWFVTIMLVVIMLCYFCFMLYSIKKIFGASSYFRANNREDQEIAGMQMIDIGEIQYEQRQAGEPDIEL